MYMSSTASPRSSGTSLAFPLMQLDYALSLLPPARCGQQTNAVGLLYINFNYRRGIGLSCLLTFLVIDSRTQPGWSSVKLFHGDVSLQFTLVGHGCVFQSSRAGDKVFGIALECMAYTCSARKLPRIMTVIPEVC